MLLLVLVLFFAGAACEAHLRAHATETDVATLLVLVFPLAQVAAQVGGDVLPGAATHYLALHLVGVFLGGIVAVFRVKVAGKAVRLSVKAVEVHSETLPAMSKRPKSLGA